MSDYPETPAHMKPARYLPTFVKGAKVKIQKGACYTDKAPYYRKDRTLYLSHTYRRKASRILKEETALQMRPVSIAGHTSPEMCLLFQTGCAEYRVIPTRFCKLELDLGELRSYLDHLELKQRPYEFKSLWMLLESGLLPKDVQIYLDNTLSRWMEAERVIGVEDYDHMLNLDKIAVFNIGECSRERVNLLEKFDFPKGSYLKGCFSWGAGMNTLRDYERREREDIMMFLRMKSLNPEVRMLTGNGYDWKRDLEPGIFIVQILEKADVQNLQIV